MVGIALHFWPSIQIDFAVQARAQKYHFAEIVEPVFMLAQCQFFPLLKRKQIFDLKKGKRGNEHDETQRVFEFQGKVTSRKETLAASKIAYFPTI